MIAILNISGDVALTVLGAAAIAAFTGGLTAWTTNRRQAKQLEHERQRVERELEHDRWMRTADELRSFLDQAATVLADVQHHATVVLGRAAVPEQVANVERIAEAVEAYHDEVPRLGPMYQRLCLRVGADHDVARAYMTALEVAASFGEQLSVLRFPLDNSGRAQIDAHAHRIQDAQNAFLDEANRILPPVLRREY